MDWENLRYVLAIGRGGTLAAAARRLDVNQTTVARRLAAAEAALGARLFERIEGRLHPTGAGEDAIARAAEVEGSVAALEQGVGDEANAAGGRVRLTAVPVLANRLLIPAMPAFLAAHPRLRLELVAEARNLSLTRREADIALRLSRPEQGAGVLTRRIGRLDYAAYGPRSRRAAALPWIGYEEGQRHLPHARWLAERAGESPLAVNDAEGLMQAIRAGLGKSLLPCRIADDDAQLARIGAETVLSREVWLLTYRDLRRQARIEAVVSWLETMFAKLAA